MGEKFIKRQIFVMSVFVVGFTILALAGSYAIFSKTDVASQKSVVRVGELELSYTDSSTTNSSIQLVSPYPISDEDALKGESSRFRIKNTGTLNASYVVKIVEDTKKVEEDNCKDKRINDHDIKIKIDGEEITSLQTKASGGGVEYTISSGNLAPGEKKDHEIRLWLAENSPNSNLGKHFHGKIQVEIVQITGSDASRRPEIIYTDEVLHGADPVLSKNLIPVTIANDGTVRRADLNRKWYDYTNKVWANAVVLEDNTKEYQVEEVIPEEAIESYFVWIPRYKYKIFNEGNYSGATSLNANAPQTIEIEFETKETAPLNGSKVGEWLSHPAFQAFDTNGFWVGKFESGYRGATTAAEAQVGIADSTKLVIKPNTYSWRNITIGNIFKTSYEYLRDNESHMMKNTEWGAAAYLSHSHYGVNTEVYSNSNSSFLTGCGGDTADASPNSSCFNAFGSKTDGVYNQSTTGNISGIFDMSGGTWEYVMGYTTGASSVGGSGEITSLYSDFFSNSEWDKYYDKYTSTSYTNYNNRILGDATGEMGPFNNKRSSWYSDYAYFVYSSHPWFGRGGHHGSTSVAGMFNFDNYTGGSGTEYSFRVVLAS